MDTLLKSAGHRMNCIHFAAIITATAQLWSIAKRNAKHRFHNSLHFKLEALYKQCILSLQPLLADIAAQQISTVMWSSAKFGFSPDGFAPSMVHALTGRFLDLIGLPKKNQQPNAQSSANLLWALATMAHPAATRKLLDPVCSHFARVIDSSDAMQRPNAQAVSTVMWSLGTLDHTPQEGHLLEVLCEYFTALLHSTDHRVHPSAQAISL